MNKIQGVLSTLRHLVSMILILSFTISFPASLAYHEERQNYEMTLMSGIYNPDMTHVLFPKIDKDYRLQVVLRDTQYENSTLQVGYGFSLVEREPSQWSRDLPMGFEPSEKIISIPHLRESKNIDTSKYEFPIIVNFTVSFEKPGLYRYLYFEHSTTAQRGGSEGGGYHIVSKYSKAIDENGYCKNPELLTLAKHDFSNLVCVSSQTHHELITRGWGPFPG